MSPANINQVYFSRDFPGHISVTAVEACTKADAAAKRIALEKHISASLIKS